MLEVQIDNTTVSALSPYVTDLHFHEAATIPLAGQSIFGTLHATIDFQADKQPVAFTVTIPDGVIEALQFNLDITASNHSGQELRYTSASLIDGQTIANITDGHSPFAHFHNALTPGYVTPTYKPTFESAIPYNNTTGTQVPLNGSNKILFTGKLLANTSAEIENYGVDQKPSVSQDHEVNGGSFYIVISPDSLGYFDSVQEGDGGNNILVGDVVHDGSPPETCNDLIYGYDGDDDIDTGLGNDTAVGGPGNDTIKAGLGNNYILGGEGDDTAVYAFPKASFIAGPGFGYDIIITGNGISDNIKDVEHFEFSDITVTKAELLSVIAPILIPLPVPIITDPPPIIFPVTNSTTPVGGVDDHSMFTM